ncbi:sugar phosphate isomerase/epimerase family protein [Salinibacterium sp. PAMC 21357]|uniref:sugar phosphate isomerase/epimerase family protein n=1 Tax=Salinibacterium sp. PAMC 21357 TaxID=1112215 RepID=UPI0002891EBD|nr:sugar phosphate isomerase/epimerase family protein [Salinibacterium sp. PAMC 21357]
MTTPAAASSPQEQPMNGGTSAPSRLSLNQATIKYADLTEALAVTSRASITSIGTWREPVQNVGLPEAVKMIEGSGLRVSSHCRGGFFTTEEGPIRRASMEDNKVALDEAAALGAPALVLVAGGLPEGSRDLVGARERVRDAIGELAPYAKSAGVTLAIEPLHPMYVSDRAVISTLGQALDIAEQFDIESVGVVVDSFHVWWDPTLFDQIARAGARIASYQVCDWVTPLASDVLLSRGMMGDGHIDFGPLTTAVANAGYVGDIEVEIFNQAVWDTPYDEVARRVVETFAQYVAE